MKKILVLLAILTISLAACKKKDSAPDEEYFEEEVLVKPDSAKTIFLGQLYDQGPIIKCFDAASGALVNTFNIPGNRDAISLQAGNGYLYNVEGDGIKAINVNTGAVAWTTPIVTNNGAVLHDQTFYGIMMENVDYYQVLDDKNCIYAVDATKASNTFLWSYKINLMGMKPNNFMGDPKQIPDPVYSRGAVYAMSDPTHLVALNAKTGKLKWSFTLPAGFDKPAVDNGTVYVSVTNTLYLIDATTGALKNKFTFADYIGGISFIYNNAIYHSNGAFNMDGSIKWKANTFNYNPIGLWNDNVVAIKDSAYLPDRSTYHGHLPFLTTSGICLTNAASGKQKWILDGYYDSFSLSSNQNAIIAGNTMYGLTYQRFDAIDLYTGKIKWSTPVPAFAVYGGSVLSVSGKLYSYLH